MAVAPTYELSVHTRRYALSVYDALAKALGTRGPVPPPLGDVRCTIERQIAPAAATFDPPLTLWTMRNRSGFVILDGTYMRPGASARLPLGDGTYALRITSTYYQDLPVAILWPPANDSVRLPGDNPLLPSAAYPFPPVLPATFTEPNAGPDHRPYSRGYTLIRGSVFEPSGRPVVGATAELVNFVFDPFPPVPDPAPPAWTFLRCTTGANGDWAILLPDRLRFKNVAPTTTAPVMHAAPSGSRCWTDRRSTCRATFRSAPSSRSPRPRFADAPSTAAAARLPASPCRPR